VNFNSFKKGGDATEKNIKVLILEILGNILNL